MENKMYYVYMLTNYNNLTIYIGITNNLKRRVWEHKNKIQDGFTKKYNINKLVYYEISQDVNSAINRETIEKLAQRLENEFNKRI